MWINSSAGKFDSMISWAFITLYVGEKDNLPFTSDASVHVDIELKQHRPLWMYSFFIKSVRNKYRSPALSFLSSSVVYCSPFPHFTIQRQWVLRTGGVQFQVQHQDTNVATYVDHIHHVRNKGYILIYILLYIY